MRVNISINIQLHRQGEFLAFEMEATELSKTSVDQSTKTRCGYTRMKKGLATNRREILKTSNATLGK
jgi:hypothetical protein